MVYKPILIDRKNLTFCGVTFPDLDTLEKTANAIGTNMLEGFEPTPEKVEIIRDYVTDIMSLEELIQKIKES